MKYELKYIVAYADGTWAGMFSTEKRAIKIASKRRRKGEERCLGIFTIAKGLTKRALPKGCNAQESQEKPT